MPVLPTLTVAPEAKFVPVSVTFTFVPGAPEFGLRDVRVGVDELMLNVTGALVPPAELLTVTLAVPTALADMANVAVI